MNWSDCILRDMNSTLPEIGRALVHSKMLADLAHFLNHLNATRPCSNDGNSFVSKTDFVVRPVCRVIHLAMKIGRAFEIRYISVSNLAVLHSEEEIQSR